MLASFVRLFAILFRDRGTPDIKLGVRYRVTLDLNRVLAGMPKVQGQRPQMVDVGNWLMKAGLTPTTQENVWKAEARFLKRLPKEAIVRAEKL